MLVNCPDCTRSYHVDAAAVGDAGRVLICPRCGARWFCIGERSAHDGFRFDLDGAVAEERRPGEQAGALAWSFPPLGGLLRPMLATVLAVMVATAAICERRPIVRHLPGSAPLYAALGLPVNLHGLEVGHLVAAQLASTDLTVSGQIRNVAHRRLVLPRVAFEICDSHGATLLSWSERPPVGTIAAGQIVSFASMPHSVPLESRTVRVRLETNEPSVEWVAQR